MKQFWGWIENHDGQITIVSDENQTEVSAEVINTIAEKSKVIGRFISYHLYFEMLFRNFIDVLGVINEFEQAEQDFKYEHEFIPYSYNINRLFMNALGSISIYINHYETSRSDANISHDTKRLTSKYYDEYPLYRFLYKLRNYAVHVGLPITLLSTTSPHPGKEFYLDRDYLLENYDSWSPRVIADIKSFDENISVRELTENAIKLFSNFHLELMSEQISEIIAAQQYFDSFGRISRHHIQYPMLLKVDEENTSSMHISDLFTDNVVQVEHAFQILGIDPHSGMVIKNET